MKSSLSRPGWERTDGTYSRNSKLTDEQVQEIRNSTLPKAKLVEKYKISARAIYNIQHNRSYKRQGYSRGW